MNQYIKNQLKGTKTLAIKAELFNHIGRTLHRFKYLHKRTKIEHFSEREKIEFFDNVFKLSNDARIVLRFLKNKRKFRAKVEAERVKRGYVPKKKTSKAEYDSQRGVGV